MCRQSISIQTEKLSLVQDSIEPISWQESCLKTSLTLKLLVRNTGPASEWTVECLTRKIIQVFVVNFYVLAWRNNITKYCKKMIFIMFLLLFKNDFSWIIYFKMREYRYIHFFKDICMPKDLIRFKNFKRWTNFSVC